MTALEERARGRRVMGRNAVWLAAGEAVTKGALMVVTILVAQRLGTAAMGLFTVASGVALVAMLVLAWGQQEVLIREVARRPAAARALAGVALRGQARVLITVLPAVIAALLLLPLEGALATAIAGFLPYAVLRTSALLESAVFKGLDRMRVDLEARSVEAAVAVIVVWGLTFGRTPVWALGLALAAGAGAGLVWLGRRLGQLSASDPPLTPRRMLGFGSAFVAIALLTQLLLRADTFLMAALGLPAADIGLYGAAATLFWGLLALPQVAAVAIYPTVARHAADGARPAKLALAAGGAGLALGLLTATFLALAGEPLLGLLFGSAFSAAAPLAERLAWALPGASATMVLGVVPAAWRRPGRTAVALAAAVTLALALDAWRLPRLGVEAAPGVAVAAHSAGALLLAALALTLPASGGTGDGT